MAYTTRAGKGSALTWSELDNNFLNMMRKGGATYTPWSGWVQGQQYVDCTLPTTASCHFRLHDSGGVRQGYLYMSGDGVNGGFLDNDGSWAIQLRYSTNYNLFRCNNNAEFYVYSSYTWCPGNSRAPIFYDVNNTSYYADLDSTGDSVRCAGYITAYVSDERLKDIKGPIDNALDKTLSLTGFYYTPNKKAQELGYKKKRRVGVSAQAVQRVLPEIIKDAPVDARYMTVDYERLTPLLIEAVKELKEKFDGVKQKAEAVLS